MDTKKLADSIRKIPDYPKPGILFYDITTMIGNAAGPVMSIYLLSVRLPKFAFVGTSAWFFMIVNYLKVPLQIFAWDNISWNTIAVDALAVPFIFLGAAIGVWAVKKMPEGGYRTFVEAVTALSALALFF